MIDSVMTIVDNWQRRDRLLDFLAAQLKRGRLSLVLGSGVSQPFGLPSWEGLIQRLYQSVEATPPEGMTLPRQAEVFKEQHCRDSKNKYLDAVRRALYGVDGVSLEQWLHHPLLSAVGALVMASRRGNVSNVISFNFDDILEKYLEFHGVVVSSICSAVEWADNSDVRIYHPHGFVPSDGAGAGDGADIVLDQFSFVKQFTHGGWREQILPIMRSHFCLFIGLSGKDDNLDIFLEQSHSGHVALSAKLPFWGVRFSDVRSDDWDLIWKKRGVFTWVVKDYEAALPLFLLEMCRRAALERRH